MPETQLVDTLDLLVTNPGVEVWVSEFTQEKSNRTKQRIYRKIEGKVETAASILEERYKTIINWVKTHKGDFYTISDILFNNPLWNIEFDPFGNPIIASHSEEYAEQKARQKKGIIDEHIGDHVGEIYLEMITGKEERYVTLHPNSHYGKSITLDIKKERVLVSQLPCLKYAFVRWDREPYTGLTKQIKREFKIQSRKKQQEDNLTFTRELAKSANKLIRRYSAALSGMYNFILPIDPEGAKALMQVNP